MMTSQIKADSETVNVASSRSSSLVNGVFRVFQRLISFQRILHSLYIRVRDRDGSRHKIKTKLHTTKIKNIVVFFLFLRGTFLTYGTLNFQTSNRLFPDNNLTWMEWKRIEYAIFFWIYTISFPLRFYRNYFLSAMYFEVVLNAASETALIMLWS